jgi:predicted nucleic acid-binding protein
MRRPVPATRSSAQADYIVTGDKAGVLKVRKHGGTRILTVAQFVALLD